MINSLSVLTWAAPRIQVARIRNPLVQGQDKGEIPIRELTPSENKQPFLGSPGGNPGSQCSPSQTEVHKVILDRLTYLFISRCICRKELIAVNILADLKRVWLKGNSNDSDVAGIVR